MQCWRPWPREPNNLLFTVLLVLTSIPAQKERKSLYGRKDRLLGSSEQPRFLWRRTGEGATGVSDGRFSRNAARAGIGRIGSRRSPTPPSVSRPGGSVRTTHGSSHW